MTSCQHALAVTVAAGCLGLAACGGGDPQGEAQSVAVEEVTSLALGGDWPSATREAGVAQVDIRTADQWADLWARRLQTLDCSQAYNQEACAATTPPRIDFDRYRLVGLFLGTIRYWQTPTPRSVTYSAETNTVTVRYEYGTTPRTPFFNYTMGRFFLLPKSEASLVVTSRGD